MKIGVKIKTLLQLLSLALIFTVSSQAQQVTGKLLQRPLSLVTEVWTVENGLPVNSLLNITQDDKGYLWITTYDGLIRFDGLNFEVYNFANTPEMVQNRTTNLHYEAGTGLWVAIESGGLLLKSDTNIKYYGAAEGFTDAEVKEIITDHNGRVYFLTLDGLYIFDRGKFVQLQAGNWYYHNQKIPWYIDEFNNTIWLGTAGGLLHIINKYDTEFIGFEEAGRPGLIYDIEKDGEGRLIAGTKKGIYEVENGVIVPSRRYRQFDDIPVYLFWVSDETMLFSTSKGVYKKDGEKYTLLKTSRKPDTSNWFIKKFYETQFGDLLLIDNMDVPYVLYGDELIDGGTFLGTNDVRVRSFFEGNDPSLWVATYNSGLYRLIASEVINIGAPEGLAGDNILGLLEDSRGRYWVGLRDKGLNLIDGDEISHFNQYNGLVSDIVQAVAEDSTGAIWAGHYRFGLDRIENGKITHYDFSLETNDVRALYTAHNGTIWAGTYGGLYSFNPDFTGVRYYGTKEGLAGTKVRYVTEGSDGSIWSASIDGGVSRLSNGLFTNYTMNDGMSSNNIRSLYIDESQVVWAGTENMGLNRIKEGKITSLTKEDGLPDHIIHWISEDEFGFLWLLSNRGVFRINKTLLNEYLDGKIKNLHIITYDKRHGMRSAEGNGAFQEAGIKTSDGRFWFATQKGVAVFNRNNPAITEGFPKTGIYSIVAGEEIFTADSTNTIRLSEPFSAARVYFKAITFSHPSQIKFRYRLPSLSDSWKETTTRAVTLTDLPPGMHTFQLQAANSSGVWSEETAEVNIFMPAKFYQKFWFYILLALILITTYYLLIRISHALLIRKQEGMQALIDEQTRQLQQEKEELEKTNRIIEEQALVLSEANKSKDKFFSIIGHDLRNPFQSLLGFSEILLKRADTISKEELSEAVTMIRNSAETMYKLTEDLLKWSSLQSGRVHPRPEVFPVEKIVAGNAELMKSSAVQKNIALEVNLNSEILVFSDVNMADTILRNLLSNAIKFTPRGGAVILTAAEDTGKAMCKISVRDTGIGMSHEHIDAVLNLDSHTSRPGTESESGSGLGLILCHEMAILNNGRLEIESAVGKGTNVTVSLPLAVEK